MIEALQLTKRYGEKTAVDHLDFTVRPGAGFLGPNGAGKSTTMRIIIGPWSRRTWAGSWPRSALATASGR